MPSAPAAFRVGRVATGATALVIGAGLIAAATFLPLPSTRLEPSAVSVTPVPSTDQVICAGSVLRLGDESGTNATSASPIGSPAVVRASTAGEVESRVLAATDAGGGVGAPTALSAPSAPDAVIAGAQSQSVSTEDYRGFAAAACTAPSSDAWIVGGSTAVGRTALLTIANPGTVSSTVSLEIYTEEGLVEAAGTNGIIVAAGSQRVVSLAGFAPSLESLAVHVTSRGGPVAAAIQQSIVRGIDPGGVDIVGSTGVPSTILELPGLTIANGVGVQGLLGLEGYADLDTVLRVLVPGPDAASATVSITPAVEGGVTAGFTLDLEPGIVTDVPLDDLEDGVYSIRVETDAPVVAALRASAVDDEDVDLAWYTAAAPLTGDALVPVAAGPGATITLSNTTDSTVSASLDGEPVELGAGEAIAIAVDDARSYQLSGGAGLAVSVGYSGGNRLASYAISASATAEAPVVVRP